MKDQNPFDDTVNKRLGEHETPVPEDMFERILRERANRLTEADDTALRDRLGNYISIVPSNLFDKITGERDTHITDANLRQRLDDHISAVPSNLFDKITTERDTHISNDDLQPALGEKLADFKSPVPPDMFDKIMAERDSRKPVIAWWQSPRLKWAIAASLLLFVSGLIGYNAFKKIDLVEKISKNQDSITKNTSSALKTEESSINTEGGKNLKNQTTDVKLTTPKTKTYSQIAQPETLNLKSKTQKSVLKAASNSTIITANFETPNYNPNNIISQNTPLETKQLIYNPIIISENPENTVRSVVVVSPLKGLITEGVATSPLSHEKAIQALPCQGPDAGCPTFGPTGIPKTFYLDAYFAPENSMRSLKAISNEFLDYRNSRDTTEKVLLGFSTGIRASVVFDNGISIRAGAVYAQKNERYRRDSAIQGNIIWKIVQKPDGTKDTLSADIENTVSRKTRYNHYRTIDFTVQLGYELPIADKITVGINAGANIGLYNSIKATVLGKDLNAYSLSESNTIYNKSVGVSLVASVAAYWNFTDRMQLMVEPQFRHYLSPLTKNPEYQLQQSYNHLGLAVGVRFRLNRNGLKVL
jgi:hypothetical protein